MDWYEAIGFYIEDWQAPHLEHLDELRTNSPILWSLIRGAKTSQGIATSLLWPHKLVLDKLRDYKKTGWAYDEESTRGMVWKLHTDNLPTEIQHLIEVAREFKSGLCRQVRVPPPEDDIDWSQARVLGEWHDDEAIDSDEGRS